MKPLDEAANKLGGHWVIAVFDGQKGGSTEFYTSTDLKKWTLTPPECNYSKDRYTAPHALRWLDGYYYDFYLEYIRGKPYKPHGYEMYVVRSGAVSPAVNRLDIRNSSPSLTS